MTNNLTTKFKELFAHLTQLKDLERNDFFNLINLKFLMK